MTPITDDNPDAIDMQSVADSALDDLEAGVIVQGEVVTVDSGFAYVNIGTKSDGRVGSHRHRHEFRGEFPACFGLGASSVPFLGNALPSRR